MGGSWASRSPRLGRIGVLIAGETTIHRLFEQGQQPVLHPDSIGAAGAAFMDKIVSCPCESQSGIELAACQESSGRGDGSVTKYQADSTVEVELQIGAGTFTHWAPPARMRYPKLGPASSASLVHIVATMPV